MPRAARIVIPDCPHHVGQRGSNRQDVLFTEGDWGDTISHPQDEEMVTRLRTWTLRDCPSGSDGFIAKLESLLSRQLRPHPRGRPRKRKREKGNRPE